MTTIDYQDISPALPERMRPGVLTRLRGWLANRRERRHRRQALAELSRLDDHLLRDIGISHGDIRFAMHGRRSLVWLQTIRRRSDH
jgi:uncharacterized protein YjiS (DUF1127 family)